MNRPLVLSLLYTVASIVVARFAGDTVGLTVFFLLGLCLCLCLYVKFKTLAVFMFIVFFGLGVFRTAAVIQPSDPILEAYANSGTELTVLAKVTDISGTASGRQRIEAETYLIKTDTEQHETEINFKAVLEKGEEVRVGQQVVVKGGLLHPSPVRNPGGFDEYTYLKARSVDYKMFPKVVSKGEISQDLNTYLYEIREKISAVFDNALPQREAAVIKSMILGDKSDLDEEISHIYKEAGIYHILVISGLHITVLCLCFERLFALFIKRRFAGIPALFLLVLYCLLTGSSVSTVRAVTMFGILAFARLFRRDYDMLSSVAFSCIALLLFQPFYLWNTGFLLTYSSVFGIGYGYEPMLKFFSYLKRYKPGKVLFQFNYLNKALALIVAVQVANAPVIACQFNYYATYSVLTNLIIIPTVCLTVALGMVAGVVGLVVSELAVILGGGILTLLKAYEWISSFFRELPFAKILIGQPSFLEISLWFTALAVLYLIISKKKFKHLKYSACFFVALVVVSLIKPIFQIPTVTMMDVGQGDSFIIEATGKVYIVDCGNSGYGESVILPYLNMKGIHKIDGVFISHFDKDHSKGLEEIIGNKQIAGVYSKEGTWDSEKYRKKMLKLFEENNIPFINMKQHEMLTDGELKFLSLSPTKDFGNPNDNSLILKFSYGRADFLFTGDTGKNTEKAVLAQGDNLNCEVIKLAHHGSKHSSTEEFLKSVSPKAAIVSAGVGNMYKHPSKEVTERLKDMNIPYFSTVEKGAVTVQIKDGGKELAVYPMIR